MFETFVLGKLITRPMHGYAIHQSITYAIGPTRSLSWGALYPLIRKLEREGLIALDLAESSPGDAHRKKLYCITDAGINRFKELMNSTSEFDADYPDLFHVKLSYFAYCTREEKLAILREYQHYLRFVGSYLRERRMGVETKETIADADRAHILRVIAHRLTLLDTDSAWADTEVRFIESDLNNAV